MLKERIEQILNEKGIVQIKIYSLEYTIELIENKYVIYANYYKESKKTYNSLKELLSEYKIYNESIIDNINRIGIL